MGPTRWDSNRRTLVVLAVALVTVFAGCSTGAAAKPGAPVVPVEPDYGDWFDGVSNYEHTVDLRGQERVTVQVGSDANMGAFGFGEAAVAVSPGTTVVWEWTGRGGGHNVVADDGGFDSGDPVRTAGYTFEHTFGASGVYRYVCEPHDGMGMRGVVVVLDGDRGT